MTTTTLTPAGLRAEARGLLIALGDRCPSALRAPLRAVQDGTAQPGTDLDVLGHARDVLDQHDGAGAAARLRMATLRRLA